MPQDTLDTHQKALTLNLARHIYGTIAEIGAGQEVAAWFFRVGATSGTVAQTVSAYDMTVSDERYGQVGRHVSKERLKRMLESEFALLVARLREKRGGERSFFAFASTVSAQNYSGTNICHGWVGLRFQSAPGSKPNTIVLHTHMRDPTNLLQQEALGILGINVIYGAFYLQKDLGDFLPALLDDLSLERIEVDYLSLEGPTFATCESGQVNLELLQVPLCSAILFEPAGLPIAPIDALYKRPVVIERGGFLESESVYEDLLSVATEELKKEIGNGKRTPIGVPELTLSNLPTAEMLAAEEVLRRVAGLNQLGRHVLVSRIAENFRLTEYLMRFQQEHIGYALGISNLIQLFEEGLYREVEGGTLAVLSALFAPRVRLYVFGMPVEQLQRIVSTLGIALSRWEVPQSGLADLTNVSPRSAIRHIFRYGIETGVLVSSTAPQRL